jgi:hypothetical protein
LGKSFSNRELPTNSTRSPSLRESFSADGGVLLARSADWANRPILPSRRSDTRMGTLFFKDVFGKSGRFYFASIVKGE